jgi:predicted amidohydrolase
MNCVEIEFPEIARTLVLRGAEVLLVGSANMHPYFNDHRIACEGRAIENKRPLVYVNRVGQESEFRFCGGSRFVSPRGDILRELDSSTEESCIVTAELDEPVATEIDFLGYLRPELYQNAKAPMG